jgi:prepilin-type N-terminal cleavage/methylation domain-containing protein
MLNRIREAKKNEKGFTLIELLIVIVILGILAAIVVFAVGGVTDRGTASACKTDRKSVETAGEAYFAQNGSYAPTGAALVPGFLHAYPATNAHYGLTYALVGSPATSFTVTAIAGTQDGPPSC